MVVKVNRADERKSKVVKQNTFGKLKEMVFYGVRAIVPADSENF